MRPTDSVHVLALMIGAALAGGCVIDGTDNGGGDGSGSGSGSTTEVLIDGVPATEYYAQFSHATTGTGIEGAAAFATTTDGRNVFLATFFLMPGGQLQLFYKEGEGEVDTTGWSINTFSGTQRKRTGTWKVDGAKLVLDSWMSCTAMDFNDKPALYCTLTTTIVTPAAQGRSGMYRPRFGASSPDDSEFADYVP